MPVTALLVRNGEDYRIPDRDGGHIFGLVYGEMLIQITMDCPGLGDPLEMTAPQILFFYDGIRHTLKKRTGEKKGG